MFDDHVDELDLLRGGRSGRQELAECFGSRSAVEPNQRADEAAKPLACVACALNIARVAYTGLNQHLFKLGQVGRGQRLTMSNLMKDDVIFMSFEEMPGLLFEAREVRLAHLRQPKLDPLPNLVGEV